MRSALVLLVVAVLILSACAPQAAPTATVPPAPSETPAPSATPAPTATSTATPTATPTPIPTLPPEQVGGLEGVPDPRYSNPEFFDLNAPEAPIPQFVRAMGMVGLQVNPEEIVDNLEFRQITGVDGNEYVIARYTVSDSDQTPYTVAFIGERQKNGEWEWRQIYPKDAQTIGIKTGISSWIEFTELWNPLSHLMPNIYKQFSVNLIDGEAMWYIPYSPTSSLRPSRDSYNYRTLDKALNYNRMGIIVQSILPSGSNSKSKTA
jgi:hypothetical protein